MLVVAFASDIGKTWFLAPLALIGVGLFMALHGAIQLLPWRPYGVPSDGLRILSLVRGTASGRRWIALRAIVSRSEAGTRPRDWPVDELNTLAQSSDGSIDDVSAALTLYWHLLDNGRLDDARNCLEQARAAASQHYMTQLPGQLVLLELAYIEARIGVDPAVAVSNLMRSAYIAPATLGRVVAALQLSYARFEDARQTAEAASTDLSGLRPGFALMEKDLLADLVGEAERRREGLSAGAPLAAAQGTATGVDVTRFESPDVQLREPLPPPGLRSARALVGIIGSATLGLTALVVTGAFDSKLAPGVAITSAGIGMLSVFRVRMTHGVATMTLLRQGLVALATFAVASPLLLSDLLITNTAGYIWVAGQARPCAAFGTGHDVSSTVMFLFGTAFALLGVLIGTRADREPLIPREGIFVGLGAIGLWIILIASDHARFAAMIGCTPAP